MTILPHPIEPELTGRTPRAVRFTRGTQIIRASLLALLIGVVGLAAWLASRDMKDLTALHAVGQTTTASVMRKHTAYSKTTSYYLDYGYLGNWVWVDDDEEVSESEYIRADVGDQIPITFLPSHPQTHRVGAVTQTRVIRQRARWEWGGVAAFVLLGAPLFFMERSFRNHRHLLRDGVPAAAVVTERQALRGKAMTYYIRYSFPAGVAGSEQARKVPVPQRLCEDWIPGTTLTVLHDARHPGNNAPYRLLTDVILV